jgi:two-component system, OmpR family, phosphate regulon sensor histidine kinase PhoR
LCRRDAKTLSMANEKNLPWATRLQRAWGALRGESPTSPAAAPSDAPPPNSSDLFEALLAGLAAPSVLLEREGRVIASNAAARALAPALQVGEQVTIAYRVPELADAIRRAGKTHQPQRAEFVERVPVDRWFEAFINPVRLPSRADASGELLLVTFNDLTPLRRVEEMRADFVANASHELRTPLAALLGFVETLQGPAKEDAAAREKFLEIMRQQASRMARLIDDLLSLSRIELNAHVAPQTVLELQSIARQVVDGLMPLAREREVQINVDVVPESLIVVGDRDELIRALENLVENALKYGASGKRADVTLTRGQTRAGGAEARIRVRDFGPGIAPEHLPRLTERFYRVDVTDSRSQGGTGLGLALVKHVLSRHGGRLAIESTLGEGASFTMHLPLRTGSRESGEKDQAGSAA